MVLTRREIASNFYSPIGYLLLLGMVAMGWFMFWQFLIRIVNSSMGFGGPMFEPIVGRFIFELFLVIVQIFIVPALTMRLLAEEQRTGTLEVLLTAPVSEATVVLSKFLGTWLFYLLTWVPWWLYLVALRYLGQEEFDYRPLLTFNIAMVSVGAGFISMGLFFSSLTRNQIIAAVLTFVGMIAHLATLFIKDLARLNPGDFGFEVLTYVSFLDLWMNTLDRHQLASACCCSICRQPCSSFTRRSRFSKHASGNNTHGLTRRFSESRPCRTARRATAGAALRPRVPDVYPACSGERCCGSCCRWGWDTKPPRDARRCFPGWSPCWLCRAWGWPLGTA